MIWGKENVMAVIWRDTDKSGKSRVCIAVTTTKQGDSDDKEGLCQSQIVQGSDNSETTRRLVVRRDSLEKLLDHRWKFFC